MDRRPVVAPRDEFLHHSPSMRFAPIIAHPKGGVHLSERRYARMMRRWTALAVAASSCAAFSVAPAPGLRLANAGVEGRPPARLSPAHLERVDAKRSRSAGAARLSMMVDPQQATDAFLALSQAAATAGGAAAAAKASGAAAASQAAGTASAKASAAASAAAVGAGGLSVESLLKQLAGVQAAISALPAVVLKDPAIKSALASLQGIAGALQGEEAKVIKTLQSIPQVKQLQGELTALAKTLEGYKQAASARLSVETLIRQLPAPLQTIEKMAEKMLQDLAAVVTVISRDSDKELFNGYPFNPQALVLWAASVFAYSSVALRDEGAVPYRAGEYDPAAAEKFYAKRWALKYGRIAQLIGILGGWVIGE